MRRGDALLYPELSALNPPTPNQVRTKRGRAYLFKAKSSGDALNWMRAMKLHTAKETENQILDRAERLVCLGELASSARIQQQAR